MRFVIQRVTESEVRVDNEVIGKIGKGFMVLIGVCDSDTREIADKMVKKMLGLRIFEDEEGKTNLSLDTVGGSLLLISQFTLYGDCSHGNRPSFTGAARPEIAAPLYQRTAQLLAELGVPVKTGVFGADMRIEQGNDGPVTIIYEC